MADRHYDGLVLFSGGLDSILAARLLQRQGLKVLGIHFFSPFFGSPQGLVDWEREYDLPLEGLDLGQDFVDLLAAGPKYGYGKALNPCIDCKILFLKRAKAKLTDYGAQFLASGDVPGQRPMSQRLDNLHLIRQQAGVQEVLIHPLHPGLMPNSAPSWAKLIDRTSLPSLRGRGRKEQLQLARRLGISQVPQPAGGCRLTEQGSAKRYWPILTYCPGPVAADFYLANLGRQFWAKRRWLCIGRDQQDNTLLAKSARATDLVFRLKETPGPLALARPLAFQDWDLTAIRSAAALNATFSARARVLKEIPVLLFHQGKTRELLVQPEEAQALPWQGPQWDRPVGPTNSGSDQAG
jgi:hypothetical protein